MNVDVVPNPFTPIIGGTQSVSVSAVSARVAISTGGTQVRIANAGSAVAFVRWGTGNQTAVVTDMPIFPGTIELFNKTWENNSFAAITTASTTVLYVTVGNGV